MLPGSRHRSGILIAGASCGLLAAGLLMMPARTPAVAIAALGMPLIAGVIAAIISSRAEARELDVDEAAMAGAKAGVIGGFIVAVPFPLALHLYVQRGGAIVTAASIGFAIAVLLAFIVLSTVAAVIGARVHARFAEKGEGSR